MFRFAIKAGLAASAVYYLNNEGIWKESNESLKAYDKLNTTLKPYVQEVRKQVPFELPEIPSGGSKVYNIQTCWNTGVTSTFQFLSELPNKMNKWAEEGVSAILQNPDMKKILDISDNAATVKK
ncbi:MICOS complex subunit MIC13 homolog QIL1 [Tribolium madens]|uniref:MICOS complex subunit MIC13 homolog QIL1 n=1 Tax=Tribolium madens TaxID=41895 RepID=UPI001CF7358F|nr:MICOS complex subunit MIC13 homolog QIL1 [Tribolium madens]